MYDTLLAPSRARPNVQVLEIGVWYGKSLAMWCDFFDDATPEGSCTVHGVDCDLRRYREHRPDLEALGAFRRNRCVVWEFDTRSSAFQAFCERELPALDLAIDVPSHCLEPVCFRRSHS